MGKCGSGHTLTGNIPQGNATYDAATRNMESPWKMPTLSQCNELINTNNTTSEWTTMNGVNGRKFTNKSDSNKYIFLPANGYWNNTTHSDVRVQGCYRSTGYYNYDNTWCLYFYSSTVSKNNFNRFVGVSIRGIQ